MKFLVDANLPPVLCDWLVGRGHDAVHVTAATAADASDDQIAALAAGQQRYVITKDWDFVLLSQRHAVRVLWLRCGNMRTADLLAWLELRWSMIHPRLSEDEPLIEVR